MLPIGAMTRNQTPNLLVYGAMLQPTEPPGQGPAHSLFILWTGVTSVSGPYRDLLGGPAAATSLPKASARPDPGPFLPLSSSNFFALDSK